MLSFPIGQMVRSEIAGADTVRHLKREDAIYVTLHRDAASEWRPVGLSPDYPSSVADGDTVLKGRINYNYETTPVARRSDGAATPPVFNLGVRYGMESYFVPEASGKSIEDNVRERKVEAIVAVGRDGTAALKGLMIGGERHEDPPIL